MANLNWRGAWTNSNTYQVNDIAYYNGSSYIARDINTYVTPDAHPNSWGLLVQQGVQGIQGVPGIQGATGSTGGKGDTGATGATGDTGQGLVWRNAWSSSITYNAYDCVSFGTKSYICIANTVLNLQPDTHPSQWDVLCVGAAGATGSTGATGAAGPPLTPRGAYASGTTYAAGDVVTEGGSSYISLVSSNTGHDPASSPTQWMLNAAALTFDAAGTAQLGSYVHAELPSLRNLFDKTQITTGYVLDNRDGSLFAFGGGIITGYIPCGGLSTLVSNIRSNSLAGIFGYVFYTISKTYISGGSVSANTPMTVPSGAAWYRQFGGSGDENTMMVVAGSTLPSTYVSFGYDDAVTAATKVATALATATSEITATAFTAEALIQAALPQTRNLFDNTRVQASWILVADGTTYPNPAVALGGPGSQFITDYIPVHNLSHLVTNFGTSGYASTIGHAFYDATRTFISGAQDSAGVAITVPAGAAYYRTTANYEQLGSLMIVGGSTLPSTYQSFGYDDAATTATKLSTALSTSRPLYGKNFGIFGDSLTQACGTFWIPPLLALTGMTNGFNDGHSGRTSNNIFENYGTGDGTGVSSGNSSNGSLTSGTTLAQDLANVDVLFVWLITNDGAGTVGSPTDSPSRTGSFCAVVNWYLPILQAAKPKLRIIGVSSYNYMPANGHAGVATAAINLQFVDAMKATYRLNGCHCIDAFELSGLNAGNWATYTSDNIHLNAAMGSEKIAPLFAREIQRFF